MVDIDFKYNQLIKSINNKISFTPDITFVLGSGLGSFAYEVNSILSISTSSLPGYPASTIAGHEGKIHFGEYNGVKILIFQGRIHFYEGYSLSQCILPVHIANQLGCKKIILTNAAGGINPNFSPGDLMLCSSLNAINLKKEITDLLRLASLEQRNSFLDFPSNKLNEVIKNAALEENICLKEGVYFFTKGPSYETPAEIKMMAQFGGDAVGMSTAHEAIYAKFVGMEVSIISVVTNYAAGISPNKLNHEEVTTTANKAKDNFTRLLKKIIICSADF